MFQANLQTASHCNLLHVITWSLSKILKQQDEKKEPISQDYSFRLGIQITILAITEMVPDLILALDFFGPQEIWSLRNLGPKKFGLREIWCPKNLVSEKFGLCIKIIIWHFHAEA